MTRYPEFLAELNALADENYKNFHKRLLKNENVKVLGVKVPLLRKLAKKYLSEVENLLTFPDEYYEVTFVKLTAVSYLPWDKFVLYVDGCVALIDNWATCDCFTPKCIQKHREEFLSYVFKYSAVDKEFYRRFALTTLLHYYVEDEYFDILLDEIKKAESEKYYYVHMASAWLLAEMLIKMYDKTVQFIKADINGNYIDKKTHNKAIQKSLESYRLSDEQKTYLKGLKK